MRKFVIFCLFAVYCAMMTLPCKAENPVTEADIRLCQLLDYTTGEISKIDYNEIPETYAEINEDKCGATISVNPSCAIISSSGSLTNWRVKPFPFIDSSEPGSPNACFVDFYGNDSISITPNTKITVLEAEYVDFEGYEFGMTRVVNGAFTYIPLDETYSGFRPKIGNIAWSSYGHGSNLWTDYWVEIALTQYDCEHKIVRAYTHLKVRIDYAPESSISEIAAPAHADGSTYNLQGQRVADPKRPGIYIVNGKKTLVK